MPDVTPSLSDRSKKLRQLYPRAKTYDELRAQQRARDERRRKALPKFVPFKVAVLVTALLLMWLAFMNQIMPMIFQSGSITGLSALFLVGLSLMFFTWLAYRRIADWYDVYGLGGRVFVVSYAVVLLVWLFVAPLIESKWPQESLLPKIVLHGAMTYLIVSLVIFRVRKSEHK